MITSPNRTPPHRHPVMVAMAGAQVLLTTHITCSVQPDSQLQNETRSKYEC